MFCGAALWLMVGTIGGVYAQEAVNGAAAALPDNSHGAAAQALHRKKLERARELDEIRRTLEMTHADRDKARVQIEALVEDQQTLNENLIETARGIQAIEGRLWQSEQRLDDLNIQEGLLRQSLKSQHKVMIEVMAVLQRIGHRPPPAVLISPQDALNSVRSAMLFGNILPHLRADVARMGDDLRTLARVRRAIARQHQQMQADLSRYEVQQSRIDALLAQKRRSLALTESVFEEQQRRAQELASRAADLRDLISRMEEKFNAAASAAQRQKVRQEQLLARTTAPADRPAGKNRNVSPPPGPQRQAPRVAFARTLGRLALPVNGAFVRRFGDMDQFGEKAKGDALATRRNATITAPSDGWVLYAARFRSYGKLLILNVGGGYHVLLAGMERIDVSPGQFVHAGEPVGQMGSERYASNAADMELSQPVLYIEFRKDDVSIDPSPWWAKTLTLKADG